jgi:hypothetical protein
MILLLVAAVFAVATTLYGFGEPLSLACVGLVAVSALRRRSRKEKSP